MKKKARRSNKETLTLVPASQNPHTCRTRARQNARANDRPTPPPKKKKEIRASRLCNDVRTRVSISNPFACVTSQLP